MRILLATTIYTLNGGGIASYNNEVRAELSTGNCFDLMTIENVTEMVGFQKVYSVPQLQLSGFSEYKRLADEINSANYDIIINSDSEVITILAPFLEARIVTISHTFNNMPAIEAGYNHKYVNKVIALSDAGRHFINNYFNITDKNKVTYIYNFVQHEVDNNASIKSKRDCLNIVFPGGASMMKYPEMVLGAVNMLLKTDLNFRFYWLGNLVLPLSGISKPKTINQLAKQDERLTFTGRIPREEAQQLYDDANIFLLPSRAEGCPMSLMEAMCSGCIPVVGSAKHVCREILDDGNFGVIVKHGSSKSLFDSLEDIIRNHEKYVYNYNKTYEYSKNQLAANVWKGKMEIAIKSAMDSSKIYIPFTKSAFRKSYYGFKYHANKLQLKERWLSIKGLLTFNYMYYFKKP
ncbi:glycosyltransferase family 4 protein [Prevotella sp. P5-64]|uniref:glycosyltransferase family 4 protein n=1 Tax=Prevotella sp. P5-64 TaxID=2024226 RepID=UPI000B974967|nr:glycosyltransferase family 4 protein [Prevotella sp. P5-64]OYP66549.1 hypothetical protein CIK87_10800 [Prevotella sp. P5-64]